MFNRSADRELKLARKPLIVLEDELWQINQLSRLRKDLRNRKKRLEKVKYMLVAMDLVGI